jgi:hypothetical protein
MQKRIDRETNSSKIIDSNVIKKYTNEQLNLKNSLNTKSITTQIAAKNKRNHSDYLETCNKINSKNNNNAYNFNINTNINNKNNNSNININTNSNTNSEDNFLFNSLNNNNSKDDYFKISAYENSNYDNFISKKIKIEINNNDYQNKNEYFSINNTSNSTNNTNNNKKIDMQMPTNLINSKCFYKEIPIYVDHKNRENVISNCSNLIEIYQIIYDFLFKNDPDFKLNEERYIKNIKAGNKDLPYSFLKSDRAILERIDLNNSITNTYTNTNSINFNNEIFDPQKEISKNDYNNKGIFIKKFEENLLKDEYEKEIEIEKGKIKEKKEKIFSEEYNYNKNNNDIIKINIYKNNNLLINENDLIKEKIRYVKQEKNKDLKKIILINKEKLKSNKFNKILKPKSYFINGYIRDLETKAKIKEEEENKLRKAKETFEAEKEKEIEKERIKNTRKTIILKYDSDEDLILSSDNENENNKEKENEEEENIKFSNLEKEITSSLKDELSLNINNPKEFIYQSDGNFFSDLNSCDDFFININTKSPTKNNNNNTNKYYDKNFIKPKQNENILKGINKSFDDSFIPSNNKKDILGNLIDSSNNSNKKQKDDKYLNKNFDYNKSKIILFLIL